VVEKDYEILPHSNCTADVSEYAEYSIRVYYWIENHMESNVRVCAAMKSPEKLNSWKLSGARASAHHNWPCQCTWWCWYLCQRWNWVTGSTILARSGRVTGQCVKPSVWPGFEF